jgi:hypothetical protein
MVAAADAAAMLFAERVQRCLMATVLAAAERRPQLHAQQPQLQCSGEQSAGAAVGLFWRLHVQQRDWVGWGVMGRGGSCSWKAVCAGRGCWWVGRGRVGAAGVGSRGSMYAWLQSIRS